MDKCEYKLVQNSTEEVEDTEFSWKYFLRQALVSSAIWISYLIYGMNLGSPTVFIPQIRKEANSTAAVSESMASWLTSIFGFAAIPWMVILPLAASYFGRKIPYLIICISLFVANIILHTSETIFQILVSEIILGIEGASTLTIAYMVLAEYSSPQYRGIFFTFKSATLFWGIWISNAIGTFFHWKNIALVTTILSIYPTVIVLLWPESPYFLASKSKFDDCAKSFQWLKGSSKSSNKELTRLLTPESNLLIDKQQFLKVVLTKRFYVPLLLGMGFFCFYHFTGKLTVAFYSIDIIKKMTSTEKSAYIGMLILDGVTVLGMYIGTILTKYVRRRVILISTALVGIFSLFALSVQVYLVSSSILSENLYLSIGFLSLYSLGIGCGPMILASTLYGELQPLQYKTLAFCITGVFDKILMGVVIKVTPYIAKRFGLHVVFFSFGVLSSIFIYLFYLYLPETKDKTLFEISDAISGENKQTKNYRNHDCIDDVCK